MPQIGMNEADMVTEIMDMEGMDMTRENYLMVAYTPDGPPKPWTAELEAQLPEAFQLKNQGKGILSQKD